MDINLKELKPKIILGIAAHPDDLDFGSSATVAHFINQGAKAHYLIITDGSKGSSDQTVNPKDLTRIRYQEQRKALKLLGGQSVTFLGYPDGLLEMSLGLKKEIVKVIRTIRPDLVITMDPSMIYSAQRGFINHPDHRVVGQAALDAVFPLARDHLVFPELSKNGLKPHKVKTVLLTNFEYTNYYVDISDTFDKKILALKAHASQIPDIDQTKIWLRQMAEMTGQKAGYKLAEGFVRIDLRI